MRDLSILIPARSEMWLKRTVEDILANKEADTEVIVGLDGEWADPPLEQHPDVNVIYCPESIGQRAITNRCASLAKGKFLMKLDAHCAMEKGFDRKMIEMFEKVEGDVVIVPIMRNLHAFDWKCRRCGFKIYQANWKEGGRCPKCGDSRYMRRKIVWGNRPHVRSTSYCFNAEPTFCYFEDWKHRPQYIKNKKEKRLTETMSLQGSCFMCTREMYWRLGLCDETLGSWGHQGIEVACKTWLSGGRVLVNHNTWYAHMFRTNANLKFPWPNSGRDQLRTKKNVEDLFWGMKWPLQKYPVSWLVKKFWPVVGWTEADLKALEEMEK